MIGLTEPQRRVWKALLEERERRGRIRSRKTLQRKLGFRTRQALDNCLRALVNKQYIEGGWGNPIRILVDDEGDGLPERARQIRDFVLRFSEENGRIPTRRQMADAGGLRSRGSLAPYLKALVEAQIIVIDENGIVKIKNVDNEEVPVIDANAEVPPGAQVVEASRIVGQVSATVANLFDARPSLFVRSDDSLRTLGVDAGDLVAVKTTSQARDGELVMARKGDRLTFGELKHIEDDHTLLKRIQNERAKAVVEIGGSGQAMEVVGIVIGTLVAKSLSR